MQAPTIIKIAGSVITDKKSGHPKIDRHNMRLIAKILKGYQMPYVLVHGAGSFGHPLAKKTGVDKTVISQEQLLAFARIQELQNRLNHIFCDIMIKGGIPAFPAQASSYAVLERGRLVKMETEAIAGLLRLRMVPVSYGVPAYDCTYGSAVLSSDQIAPWLARRLNARRLIEVCDVGGIYTDDPSANKNAEIISRINLDNYTEIEKYLSGSSAPADVTGGMRQNYFETLEAAKAGIVCQITHFKSLRDALNGKPVGTVIDLNS